MLIRLPAEARAYADRVEPLIDRDTPIVPAARFLSNVGRLWLSSDLNRSLSLLERSIELFRLANDRLSIACVQGVVGNLFDRLGRPTDARATLGEADETLSGTDRRKSLFGIKFSLGALATNLGDFEQAKHYDEQALDLAYALKDEVCEAAVLVNQAERAFNTGDLDQAIRKARRAAFIFRKAGSRMQLGVTLYNLASYHISRNELAEGHAANAEALELLRVEGGFIVRRCLQLWGLIGAHAGRSREAATITGFAFAGKFGSSEPWDPYEQLVYHQIQQLLQTTLSGGIIAELMDRGARWTGEQAVRFTVDHLILSVASRNQSGVT